MLYCLLVVILLVLSLQLLFLLLLLFSCIIQSFHILNDVLCAMICS